LSSVNLLIGVGRYDKAKTVIYEVLAKDHTDVRALCVLMRCQYALDEPSLETSMEITRLDPLHGCAWIHRALVYEDLEQWADAEENAREAVRLNPQRVDAVTTLAAVLAAQPDRSTEGLEIAREAVRLEPESVKAQSILCHAALADRKFKEAEKAIRVVLALDPENGWAMQRLAVIKVERGHYIEARRLLKAGLATDPTDDDLREAYESFEQQMFGSPLREAATKMADQSWFGPLSHPEARKALKSDLMKTVAKLRGLFS
jgi:tetratricopeptide (TPR) repeat protein